MTTTTLQGLLEKINKLDDERERIAREAFDYLKLTDPEMTNLAVEALDSEEIAAQWFAEDIYVLCNEMPLTLLARGERQLVIDCLGRIRWGMFA